MLLNPFSDRLFNRQLVKMTLPIALQSLMLSSVAAADAFMLGRVSQNAMSAVSLASQIQFIQNMIVSAVVSVIVILGSQYWGKKSYGTVNDTLGLGLKLSFLVSALFFAGCECCPRVLMLCYTSDEVLIEIGIGYLKIAGWSYLLSGISQCMLAALKISGRTVHTALISSTAVVLNILLNAALIYGLFGLAPMGAAGAALATVIARGVELVWVFCALAFKGEIRVTLKSLLLPHRTLFRDFLHHLLPLIGASLFWGVGFSAYTAFIGHLGADVTAANAIVSVVREMVCCACNGLSGGGEIMVGAALGAGDLPRGKLYGQRLCILSYLCGIVSAVLLFALTPGLLAFVTLSNGARHYFWGMMAITSFYEIGRCVNTVVINGVFGAGGDTRYDFYSLAVCMWGCAVPLAALGTFVLGWHPLAVYACTCLDEVGKIPWVMAHFKKYKWVKNLTRDPE